MLGKGRTPRMPKQGKLARGDEMRGGVQKVGKPGPRTSKRLSKRNLRQGNYELRETTEFLQFAVKKDFKLEGGGGWGEKLITRSPNKISKWSGGLLGGESRKKITNRGPFAGAFIKSEAQEGKSYPGNKSPLVRGP